MLFFPCSLYAELQDDPPQWPSSRPENMNAIKLFLVRDLWTSSTRAWQTSPTIEGIIAVCYLPLKGSCQILSTEQGLQLISFMKV